MKYFIYLFKEQNKIKCKLVPLIICCCVFSAQCSQTCGSGVRRRNVTCSRNSGVACDPQKKPLSVGSCYVQDCPQVVDNFGTDWSGSGWSSNEVLNEINSIPEVKPPPKLSTTRAQPRSQNDINDVVEGDFHYHNNIENVEVDDFYYDYNFINFHEDLSDDFEDDGNDSGDSNGVNTAREAGPTGSTGGDGNAETTAGPATATVYSPVLKGEGQLDKDEDGHGKDGEDESEIGSDNLEDFLSEDFLLPAFTTRSPPLFPTRLLKNENPWPSEKSATTPLLTTEEPALTRKNGTERGKKTDIFPEDSVTAPSTSGYDIAVHTAVPTAMGPGEKESRLGGDYSHSEEQRPSADISAEEEDATTHLQLDSSEIPQTTSQSMILPAAFTPEDSNSNLTELVHSSVQDPRESSRDPSRNSPPAPEKSVPAPTSSQRISGNQEAPRDSAPTGTDAAPPTVLEGVTAPPPADSPPASREHPPTESPPPERTGSDAALQPPASPTTLKPSQESTALSLHEAPPTHPLDPWPVQVTSSVQTSAPTQVVASAYWVAGNWSAVSPRRLHVLRGYNTMYSYSFCQYFEKW